MVFPARAGMNRLQPPPAGAAAIRAAARLAGHGGGYASLSRTPASCPPTLGELGGPPQSRPLLLRADGWFANTRKSPLISICGDSSGCQINLLISWQNTTPSPSSGESANFRFLSGGARIVEKLRGPPDADPGVGIARIVCSTDDRGFGRTSPQSRR